MRVAYFDMIGGAAGDMILGSLLDAGLSLSSLRRELAKLPLGGYRLEAHRVSKQHIAATQFLVRTDAADHHHHEHGTHDAERSLKEILALIETSDLSPSVKRRAARIFHRLGEAEAHIHGVPFENVHFHEVGAVDSIVDIVGAAIAIELLDLDALYASPFPLGSGTIETKHGTFPIPAPATVALIAGARAPTMPSAIHMEQVTPTGACILTTLATFEQPPMRVEQVGYGSGEADLTIPNVLRVWIGDTEHPTIERLRVLETNIDDMNPQLYEPVVQRCFESGALDVLLLPGIMKKGRPAIQLSVLCRPADESALVDVLMCETSTLGVRAHGVERYAADRTVDRVDTAYGPVGVKLKTWRGETESVTPEYEDCRRAAANAGVPVTAVYAAALARAQEKLSQD